jgi:hypothetical protein
MKFYVVYDAAQQGHPTLGMNAIPLVLVCAGLLLTLAPDLMQRLLPYGLQGRARRIFSWVFLCAGILGALATFIGTTRPYDTAAAASRDHRYSVVEGRVADFAPMPYTGHRLETFVVGGRKFAYSDYVLTGCFNNTTSHGGPIRAGISVRVSFVGNCIVRLEVAR